MGQLVVSGPGVSMSLVLVMGGIRGHRLWFGDLTAGRFGRGR
jgi:hypothetical protein